VLLQVNRDEDGEAERQLNDELRDYERKDELIQYGRRAQETLRIVPGYASRLRELHKALEKEDAVLDASEVKCGRVIGRGGFGDVYVGEFRGQRVAVKKFRNNRNNRQMKDFLSEVEVLRKLEHPNIIYFIGACMEEQSLSLVLEWAENGSLNDALFPPNEAESQVEFTDAEKYRIILDTALGIEYLHKQRPPILHRDLKPANVLLTAENRAKIADFGLSGIDQGENTANAQNVGAGTLYYMPPEVLQSHRHTAASDVYSFSVLVWELMNQERAFRGVKTAVSLFEQLISDVRPQLDFVPEPLAQLLERCWCTLPDERMSISDFIAEFCKFSGLARNA